MDGKPPKNSPIGEDGRLLIKNPWWPLNKKMPRRRRRK
jgi:hypothetical protein